MIAPVRMEPASEGADSVTALVEVIVLVVIEPLVAVSVKFDVVESAPTLIEPEEAVAVKAEVEEIVPVVMEPAE